MPMAYRASVCWFIKDSILSLINERHAFEKLKEVEK